MNHTSAIGARLGRLLATLFVLALLAGACGSDSAPVDSDGEAAGTDSDSTDSDAGDSRADGEAESAAPERIVSLSPTVTEVAFAIGAGDQIVAADSLSNYPPEAPTTDLAAFEPNLEAIAEYDPDLVLLGYDINDSVAGLEAIGIETLLLPDPATLEDGYAQIIELGEATGHRSEADAVVAEIQSGIEAIVSDQPADAESVRIYHEIDDSFYSVSSNSFVGQLYALLGVVNIADEADVDGFGYPQLSPEYILEADPELIVITDDVAYGPDEVAARPGWDSLTAVTTDDVIQVDADIASRWGPRVVEFLTVISDALTALRG